MGAIPTGGTSLLALPLASPRLVGEAAYAGGRFAGGASDFAQNLASRAAPISKTLTDLASKYRLPAYGAVGAANVIEQASQPEDVQVTAVSGYPQPTAIEDLAARYQQSAPEAAPQAPVVDDMSIDAMNASPAGIVIDKVTGREVTFDPDTGRRFYADTGEEYDSPEIGMYRGGHVQKFGNGGQPSFADRARSAAKGATFATNDEIEGFVRSLLSGQTYTSERDKIRKQQAAYENNNPLESLAYEMGGSMVPALIPGGQGVTAARLGSLGARAASLAAKAPRTAMAVRTAAPVAAGSVAYGAGSANEMRDIPRSVAEEALVGLGLYGAGRFAAKPVKAGYRKVRSIFR
jgi:hypothetical protein